MCIVDTIDDDKGHTPGIISIVIPVYQNADTLAELHRRLSAVFESLPHELEIVFVDDACPENSLATIQKIADADTRVRAIALARNLGQQRAIMVGVSHTRGQYVVIMDADLQDPPEAIPSLLQKITEGYEAVFAGRRGDYQSQSRLMSSRLFKGLLHLITGLPPDAGIHVIMTRKMVSTLLAMRETHPYVVGMIGCTNLALASVPVVRSARLSGTSAYSSLSRLKMGINGIVRVLVIKLRQPKPPTTASPYEVPIKLYVGKYFSTPDL